MILTTLRVYEGCPINSCRHTGQIKKILLNEGFGFIATSEGDIFLHKSQYAEFDTLKPGDMVSFEILETPKGKTACDIIREKMTLITVMKESLIITREAEPKKGTVIRKVEAQGNYFTDPHKAKAYLVDVAKQAGGNMLLNLSLEKRTVQKDYNYYGTAHSYKGEIAIVVEDTHVESPRAPSMQAAADNKIAEATAQFDAFVKDDLVEEQESPFPWGMFSVFVFCLMVGAFVLVF